MKLSHFPPSILGFIYTPKRELYKSIALGSLLGGIAAYSWGSFTMTLELLVSGFLAQQLQQVRTNTWKHHIQKFVPDAKPEQSTFSWKHNMLALALLPLAYLTHPALVDLSKESVTVLQDIISSQVLPHKEELQTLGKTGSLLTVFSKILYFGSQNIATLLSKEARLIFLQPKKNLLATLHPVPEKRKRYARELSIENGLSAIDYFNDALLTSDSSDAASFLIEQYFMKHITFPPMHLSFLYKAAMLYFWQERPLVDQAVISSIFELDASYTNYLFDKAFTQAKNASDLDLLSLLALVKQKQNPSQAQNYWKELALHTRAKKEELDEVFFGEGTQGIYVPQQKGKQKDALRLVLGIKSSSPQKLLEEIAFTESLRQECREQKTIRFPIYPYNWFDENSHKQKTFVVLEHLQTLAQVAKDNPRDIQKIYSFAFEQLLYLGKAAKRQKTIVLQHIDYEKKHLAHPLIADKKIYDPGVVRERVARIQELGQAYEQAIFDYHHNNILMPGLSKKGFDKLLAYIFKLDTEYKGIASIMFDIVNLTHYSHEYFTKQQFADIDLEMQLNYAHLVNQDIQKVISLETSVLFSRQDSFLQAWSKQNRPHDSLRRAGFLKHVYASVQHYGDFFLDADKAYLRAEIAQNERLFKQLDRMSARWG